ncbi:MAG TPA: PilZ domain-containing protein [Terriglobales bacterium]|nr:PilZ domain-containing protein [Terriglobales bacterium]
MANTAFASTRRWPRYHASLPVLIASRSESRKPVPGLACEISQGGMALYGGVDLQPGDLMEVEFQTSGKLRMAGVVRNRSGFCFGLEFLDVLANTEALAKLAQPTGRTASKKSWISSHRGNFCLAIAALLLFAAFAAPDWQPSQRVSQANVVPSLTFFERVLVGLGFAEPPAALIVTGNPNAEVWVDVHTALYYCQGSELYGKTPGGKVTTQRDAQLDQFEPAARKNCE